MTTLKEAALRYHDAGLIVLPNDPKRKYPPINEWQHIQPTRDQVNTWFSTNHKAIGVRMGDQREGIDIDSKNSLPDDPDLFGEYSALVESLAPGLLERLALERTPTGGYHLIYCCSDITGNLKLAQRPPTPDERDANPRLTHVTLIETRGKGGILQAAPSPGYEMIRGDWADLPEITPAERQVLHDCARAIDRMYQAKTPQGFSTGDRPGDAYNADPASAAEALALLERYGWQQATRRGEAVRLTRPGKTEGVSASFGHVAPGVLYVFSTSASPFQNCTAYSPFAILALLEHGGDYRAAAKALAQRGYGQADAQPGKLGASADGQAAAPVAAPGDAAPRSIPRNDIDMAAYVGDLFRGRFLWAEERQHWLRWNGSHWQEARASEMHAEIKRIIVAGASELAQDAGEAELRDLWRLFARFTTLARRKALLEDVQSEPDIAVSVQALDQHTDILPVRNGYVDLRTGKLQPHNRDMLYTRCVDVDYDQAASAPQWLAFLERVQPDPDVRQYLQHYAGYSCTGECRELAAFFYGSGSNGKTVFTETLALLLGGYSASMQATDLIVRRNQGTNWTLANVENARFVRAKEISSGTFACEVFKNLIDHGRLQIERKHQQPYEINRTHSLIIYGNNRPRITDHTNGTWRRLHMVPWNVTIPENEAIPDYERRLLSDEAPGILAWCIAGAVAFYQHGIPVPDPIRGASDAYRLEEDTIGQFFSMCVLDNRAYTYVKDLYREYCENTVTPLSDRDFTAELRRRGYTQGNRRIAGKQRKCWIGIGIATNATEGEKTGSTFFEASECTKATIETTHATNATSFLEKFPCKTENSEIPEKTGSIGSTRLLNNTNSALQSEKTLTTAATDFGSILVAVEEHGDDKPTFATTQGTNGQTALTLDSPQLDHLPDEPTIDEIKRATRAALVDWLDDHGRWWGETLTKEQLQDRVRLAIYSLTVERRE